MYTHITREHRIALGALLRQGLSQKDAAEAIGMHPSTVCRELKRNPNRRGYHATHAHILSVRRRRESKRAYRKIENNKMLEREILSKLNPLVSPETIAHDLGIAHGTIYAWLYRSRPDLLPLLPYHGKKRRKYGKNRSVKQGWTKDVRRIEERPEEISGWEGDTVRGSTKSRLLTHVERKSLFTQADLISSGEADVVQMKMKGKEVLKDTVITYDRGSEFSLWKMIERDTGSRIFFANARHPWERGKNENTNGRIRRIYPKRFNFDTLSQRELDETVWLMNHTKRKTLGWRTPCEMFGRCCTSD